MVFVSRCCSVSLSTPRRPPRPRWVPKATSQASPSPLPWKPKNTAVRIWKTVFQFNYKIKMEGDNAATGKWLKEELVELGPAFIKMGQFVSTRADVLPKGINEELKKLQDDIPPTPFEDIQSVLMEEYGSLYETLFKSIDPEPIASASIGQVHRAVLRKENRAVVVKIQKPFVDLQIRSDLDILKTMCAFFKFLNFNGRAAEFESLLRQYEDFLGGELDYLMEKSQMLYFKENVEPMIPVVIPTPYTEYSTRRVLVMEDVPSVKITDLLRDPETLKTGEELSYELVDLFLYQIIYCGVVHCDPHPGNIGMDAAGRWVLYDFGNVADLGENFRLNVRQLVVSVYQKDVDEFLELLIKMKIIQISEPMEVLELKNFFSYVFDYLEQVDFQKLRTSIMDNDLLKNANIKVKIEPQFLSLFRVFSLLDGTCLELNPEFSYLTALQPYFEDVLRDIEFMDYRMRRDVQKITSFPKMVQNAENNILQINRRMAQLSVQHKNIQVLMFVFVVVDNLDDPVRLMGLIPVIALAIRMLCVYL
jgi:predicted unusual protein kinase regulating ubiquinone biosynthesis (AarF/ABC1/UbiB family)